MSILEAIQIVAIVIVALILIDVVGDTTEELYHKKGRLVIA